MWFCYSIVLFYFNYSFFCVKETVGQNSETLKLDLRNTLNGEERDIPEMYVCPPVYYI